MKPIFKVVGGLDVGSDADRLSRAEARRRARPLNRQWLGAIDQHITDAKAPKLLHVDYRMAKELTNYPSANEGRCYAGQKRLGAKVGIAERTARASLARLRTAAFLSMKRGGPGRTASWIFCINGRPIFGSSDRQSAGQDRQDAAGQDRQDAAAKPLEREPIERKPPPKPPSAHEQAESLQAVHHGEVLGPEGEITFADFWKSIRGHPGQPGPAIAAWAKLSREDRAAIGALIGPDGIDLGGMWACTWLTARMWEQAPLRSAMDDALDALHRYAAGEDAIHSTAQRATRDERLDPYSYAWMAERARRVAARESVSLMDEWAAIGRPWPVVRRAGGVT